MATATHGSCLEYGLCLLEAFELDDIAVRVFYEKAIVRTGLPIEEGFGPLGYQLFCSQHLQLGIPDILGYEQPEMKGRKYAISELIVLVGHTPTVGLQKGELIAGHVYIEPLLSRAARLESEYVYVEIPGLIDTVTG